MADRPEPAPGGARPSPGFRWWSHYNPGWGCVGLWDTAALGVLDVSVLAADHPAFVGAAAEIVRVIDAE